MADKHSADGVTIRPHQYQKRGIFYDCFLVQGWRENGKWQRKQFADRKDAERFAALKRVEMENKGRSQNLLLTSLSEDQLREVENGMQRLGDTYTITEAIDYFLKNHRAPDFTISLPDAVRRYLEDCESAGTRERTIKGKLSVLKQFIATCEDMEVHEVTKETVEGFLNGLRAKDGISKAKRKTWNNYRNELNHFFSWMSETDKATQRPWCFENPVEAVRIFSAQRVAEQREKRATTSTERLQRALSVLMRWRGGDLVKYYALAYFAGIRPDGELQALAEREGDLINLETNVIHIPAELSKTKEERAIDISANLRAWLLAYESRPIIPRNFDRLNKQFRKHFQLQHDETRHSFISYFVALHRSVGDAALQAGNSESIVKKHYLKLHSRGEGEAFFAIVPDMKRKRAVIDTASTPEPAAKLKAV